MVQVIPCFYEEILFIFGRVVKMHIEFVPRISCDSDRHNVNNVRMHANVPSFSIMCSMLICLD